MWRQADDKEKKEYVDEELRERLEYNERAQAFKMKKQHESSSRSIRVKSKRATKMRSNSSDHCPPHDLQSARSTLLRSDSFYLDDKSEPFRASPLQVDEMPERPPASGRDGRDYRVGSQSVPPFRPLFLSHHGTEASYRQGGELVEGVDRRAHSEPLPFYHYRPRPVYGAELTERYPPGGAPYFYGDPSYPSRPYH
jgi:hypothetical protein